MSGYIYTGSDAYLIDKEDQVIKIRVIDYNVITRQAVIETPELIYETIGIDDLYETKELAEKKRNELIEKKFYA